MTIIKETSPTNFEVEQTVPTKPRARTCTLDTRNNQIILITTERPAAGTNTTTIAQLTRLDPMPGTNQPGGKPRGGHGGNNNGPAMLDIIVVGR